ncbi:kinase-like protein [Hypoxylon argillaceum]|nr:kinase-like protein [Hypoxylon argillaceum]
MCKIHAAFEINIQSRLVVLSVKSKTISTVTYAVASKATGVAERKDQGGTQSPQGKAPPSISTRNSFLGGGVIHYGYEYDIFITFYHFRLVWLYDDAESKTRALRGYQESLELLSQYDLMECDTTTPSTAGDADFEEIEHLRKDLDTGTYGTVTISVDRKSGDIFVIKKPCSENQKSFEIPLLLFHHEMQTLRNLHHLNIIPFLGGRPAGPNRLPEFYMPLRGGHLGDLALSVKAADRASFHSEVLKQMLAALDYTGSKGLIHRDVKPQNILYDHLPDGFPGKSKFRLQLADFGIAQYGGLAKDCNVGTWAYMAPEICPSQSKIKAQQTPKADMWSLFATMVAINPRFANFPPRTNDYAKILDVLRADGARDTGGPMARLNPRCRASAAQMLKFFFGGEGLTTPLSEISKIEPADEVDETEKAEETEASETEPSSTPVSPHRALFEAAMRGSPPPTENDRGSTVTVQRLSVAPASVSRPPPSEDQPAFPRLSSSPPRRLILGPETPTATNQQDHPPQPKPKPIHKSEAGVAKRTGNPRGPAAGTRERRALESLTLGDLNKDTYQIRNDS